MNESAIYIHIPFCEHKCIYCDFYSIITKDNVGEFLDALTAEIASYSGANSENRVFTSVFFGGGTPSLMEPEYINYILSALNDFYHVSADAEITLETNPGTVDRKKLEKFYKYGINRLSVGIQTFHEDELKFLTRIHDRQTAVRTVMDASEAGFKNINLDLIFNLPGQTIERWEENLRTAVSLPVTHLSAYSLILERGTILNKMVIDGKVKMQDSDYDADIYELTMSFLYHQGFRQYEISNFAKEGYECRHNNAYWQYKDYLSFGPSAHSFMHGRRWWNYSSLKKYIHEIKTAGNAVANSETLTRLQMMNEFIMLALRSSGLDLDALSRKFGGEWAAEKMDYIRSLEKRGLLKFETREKICLTSKGYSLCDEILEKIL